MIDAELDDGIDAGLHFIHLRQPGSYERSGNEGNQGNDPNRHSSRCPAFRYLSFRYPACESPTRECHSSEEGARFAPECDRRYAIEEAGLSTCGYRSFGRDIVHLQNSVSAIGQRQKILTACSIVVLLPQLSCLNRRRGQAQTELTSGFVGADYR